MYICDICGEKFEKFQSKANHVRWKHLGYAFKNEETKKNFYINCKKAQNKRYKKFIEEEDICSNTKCNKKISIKYREGKKREKYFCSRACSNTRQHSKETKEKIRKKLSKPFNKFKCLNCNKNFKIKKIIQKFCSRKCTHEYRSKEYRKNMSSYQLYKRECFFNFSLRDFPNEFEFSLVEKHGWYAAKNRGNNLNGVSRDHMFSIKEGFLQKIDPKIISHPANCQLLRHNNNVSKFIKCSLTIEKLKQRIEEWNKKYGSLVD